MSERIRHLLEEARRSLRVARPKTGVDRRRGLKAIADEVRQAQTDVLRANAEDLASATGLSGALIDRLELTPDRLEGLARAVEAIAALPDPLDEERSLGPGPSGIEVFRRRVPLGVLAVIYEARPNVTVECAALALASGNAIVLRGGKEARRSNQALGAAVHRGLEAAGLPSGLAQVLADSSREDVRELLGAVGQIDLVIPRGGERLMKLVDEFARVPVIRHGQGICQVYIHAAAQPDMAVQIAENAKVHRPGVCNAMETLLIDSAQVEVVLGQLGPRLKSLGVELRADPQALAALQRASVDAKPATAADWDTEFLDLVLAVRAVDGPEDALEHIDRHGTNHSVAIVTEDRAVAERFLREVDASCVLWNASTRFNDGFELGLGAELGISTTRMHAYGPMSLREMTGEKFVVRGSGNIRR